jgi:hypothetical protein
MKQPALFLLLFGTLGYGPALAQGRVPLTADSVALYQRHIGILPGVYRYDRHYAGDLNNDRRPDVVIVAQNLKRQPSDPPNVYSRRVIFSLFQPNGQLRNAVFNDQLLRCATCGGGASLTDPFQKVVFNGNFVSFVSTYGFGQKTTEVITFEFDPKRPDWWLHSISLQPLAFDAAGKLVKNQPPKLYDRSKLGNVRFQEFTSKMIPKK